jgi:uncharacterized protein YuzE
MAVNQVDDYIKLIPAVKDSPQNTLWLTFDEEADVLYINFKRPSVATDSNITDDDVIVRYEGDQVVGYTILHASKR